MINYNGTMYTDIAELELAIADLSENQKNYIRRDFHGIPHPPSLEQMVRETIASATIFGQNLILEFATENVLLGITQMGMTTHVRTATAGVVNALQTGSLYDAISEAKAIPAEKKDATFVTDARLLIFINKIESYLGIPLSTEL